MSTRGLMGIKKKGQLKAQYNHFDSYIEGLGKEIIETINNIKKEDRIKVLNNVFDNIVLVGSRDIPSKEMIDYCKTYNTLNLNVSNCNEEDLHCLLYETQGNLKLYIDGFKYMIDNASFINDTLFCEYAYVINLDTNKLEITYGWQNRITQEYDLLNLKLKKISFIFLFFSY